MLFSSFLITTLTLAASGHVFPRQDSGVSVDGLSMIPAESSTVQDPSAAVSVDGISTVPAESPTVQDPTAAVSVDGISMMPAESPGTYLDGATTPISDSPTPTSTPVAWTFTVTYLLANSTSYEVETVTLFPAQAESASGSVASSSSAVSASSAKKNRSGAIAGGVVGAVVVAVVAALAFLHFRNKHSPRHWRNRTQGLRWQDLDSKSAAPSAQIGYTGALSADVEGHKSPIASSVVDAARSGAADPFADPPAIAVPQSLSITHHRKQSSFGSFVGSSRHPDESIEMADNLSSPRSPHTFTPAPRPGV